jgi:hypothetical protein
MSTEAILAGQRWLGSRAEEADPELAGRVVRDKSVPPLLA